MAATAALLCVFAPASAQSVKERYTKLEYMAPMRDGTRLYTSVYVPKAIEGKHPIILERTPYGAGPYGLEAYKSPVHRGSKQFDKAGYIFAYQDVRGMGKSEGVFVNARPQLVNALKPHDIDESTDTYDAIEYLVKNVPGNNGRVGLWGISYPGFYAGVGAINSHPALKAASPQAPVSDWFIGDDFHHNGAFFLMDAISFARFGQSKTDVPRPAMPPVNPNRDPYRFYLDVGTLKDLTEKHFADTDGLWRDLMIHGTYDEYWQSRSLPAFMKGVRCAVMTVGGWFDAEDCWGALHTYAGTEKLNPKAVNTLVMGPWYHGMWASPPGTKFGDIDFGQPTSTHYQEKIEFPFFDTYLRGNGRVKQPEAQVFDTGAHEWRSFNKWPPRGTKPSAVYLSGSGSLSSSSSTTPTISSYTSDPANPVPYQGGKMTGRTREYMIDDQRFASTRSDVLTYQTPELAEKMTLAGPVTADLWATSDGTDADFVVKIIDVYPSTAPGKMANYQMLVRGEVMRAKFRHSYQNPSPLAAGKPERITFDLPDVMHTFLPGHKMMVQVQSSWFPLVDLNPHKFVDIYNARREDFRKSVIKIHEGGEAASAVRFSTLAK